MKKHYLVFDRKTKMFDVDYMGRTYFKCGSNNLEITSGWIVDDKLYLSEPYLKGQKKVIVCSHWRVRSRKNLKPIYC